ncbi:MAG: DNA replication/repair protein RecF [Methanomassiliicoccales archaeon]
MQLLYLLSRDFRNLAGETIFFGTGINVLYGANAQGKTNILEAISVLSSGNSFRGATDQQMTKQGAEGYALRGVYEEKDVHREWSTEYSKGSARSNRMGNKKVAAHHPDRLKTAVFTPEDLYLIKGPPSLRRHFLDYALDQLYNEYHRQGQIYSAALKQRNYLLRQGSGNQALNQTLEGILAESGAYITLTRLGWVKKLEKRMDYFYSALTGEKKEVKLKYVLSTNVPGGHIETEKITAWYLEAYKNASDKEKRMRNTLIGPHREDINFYLGQQLAKNYASQGEQRNLAIALKLAEIECYQMVTGNYPVFLLDEVFSELDLQRRLRLAEVLSSAQYQVIITTVEFNHELFDNYHGMMIDQGSVQGNKGD